MCLCSADPAMSADWPLLTSPDILPLLLGAMAVCGAVIGWSLWRLAEPVAPSTTPSGAFDEQAAGPGHGDVPHEAIVAALRALEGFQAKESALRARLSSRRHRQAQRRAATLAEADLVRRALHNIRLPETLAALFDSLVALSGQVPHARAASMAWHALAGVHPSAIERWVCDHTAGQVEFCLGTEVFSLGKQTFQLSSLVVQEHTLCDAQGRLLAHVRSCGTRSNPDLDDGVVTACRPGRWVGLFCDLRLGMDERRATVLMKIQCRELDAHDNRLSSSGDAGAAGSAP